MRGLGRVAGVRHFFSLCLIPSAISLGCAGGAQNAPPAPGGAATTTPSATTSPPAVASPIGSGEYAFYLGLGDWSEQPRGRILMARLNGANGAVSVQQEVPVGRLITFLTASPDKKTLYAADEPTNRIFCLKRDLATGSLSPLCEAQADGNPVYLSVDRTGQTLLTTFYNQGRSETFSINGDGTIGSSQDREDSGRRSHAIVLDPSEKFVFVPALEDDWIAQYKFDSATHQLTPNPNPQEYTVKGQRGLGPRHITFDTRGKFVYLMNELSLSVTTLSYDAESGRLQKAFDPVSTLPPGTDKPQNASAADIHVHPNGRFVYGSNRLGDQSSIAILSIEEATGAPSFVGVELTRGSTPRNFKISPDGEYLLVANQESKNLATFKIEAETGGLTFLHTTDLPEKPYFVGFY